MTAPVVDGVPLKVIDADTHYSEPPDLWTSRVPGKYKDVVPHHVEHPEHGRQWVMNGDEVMSQTVGAGSVIRKDGSKQALWDWNILGGLPFEEVHESSHDPAARLEHMDNAGIWAQIMYPNVAGFGGHRLMRLPTGTATMIVQVYNDAMAEMQAESGDRLLPMAMIPFWEIDEAVKEAERAAGMGLRGLLMCSEPHSGGLPDLLDHHWNPLWEVATEHGLPINFHIGASDFGFEAFSKGVWPSLDRPRKHVVGSVLIEIHNARVMSNLLASDLLERYPDVKFVSVESGIGWIPYVLERLEYQLGETTPDGQGFGQPLPTELFRRQVYSCFWFEDAGPRFLLERIGFDNVLFETDYPHPTCLYPNAVEHAMDVLSPWGPEVQRKVMQDNAARLYNIDV